MFHTSERIFAAADSGALVLTANNRVARTLAAAYAERQRSAGCAAWRSPDILSWSAWLQRCWEDALYSGAGGSTPALLAPHQEEAVWERIVSESPEAGGLLQIPATAQQAGKAWTLAREWRLDISSTDFLLHDDCRAFQTWALAFQNRCEGEGWLDSAGLPDALAARVLSGVLPAPARVLLIGFDEFTPQQEDLWQALRNAGCEVEAIEPAEAAGTPGAVSLALDSAVEEIRTAACWARELLANGGAGSIGIVVQDLNGLRPKLDRIFSDILHPGAVLPGSERREKCYNISLGIPLSDYPIIESALLILGMGIEATPFEDIGALLRSPFLAGSQRETAQRALLHRDLGAAGNPEVATGDLLGSAACPVFISSLRQWRDVRTAVPARRRPGAWLEVISRLLQALGWPGERPLNSAEYQTVEAWRKLLGEFAALDVTLPEIRFGDALSRLRRMAAETQFQPEKELVPVQILGVFEASGMRFDHLWIMGMHDEAWPAPPNPNPFLPVPLQRRRGLPHASAERELAFARLVTERLLASAPEVIVSYPRHEEDRELRPSPLIRDLPGISREDLALPPRETYAESFRYAALEELSDSTAPAVAAENCSRGGARLFQLQALCPFRAFAELRLGAGELDGAEEGLNAMERGNAVHGALETIWNRLQSHAALCAASAEELRALAGDAVASALARESRGRRLPPRYLELEQERLRELLLEWLEVEKERSPFTVMKPEQERRVTVGGLNVRVKIDRIDKLADEREIVIDYKTGRHNVSEWSTDRPNEPQLPLYCVTNGGDAAAVAFALLKRGELSFKGIAQEEGLLPGVKAFEAGLREQIAGWRGVLERLAADFQAGRAAVDPKDAKACEYCGLTALCRFNESGDQKWEQPLD